MATAFVQGLSYIIYCFIKHIETRINGAKCFLVQQKVGVEEYVANLTSGKSNFKFFEFKFKYAV